jgi:hypothetical protein
MVFDGNDTCWHLSLDKISQNNLFFSAGTSFFFPLSEGVLPQITATQELHIADTSLRVNLVPKQ